MKQPAGWTWWHPATLASLALARPLLELIAGHPPFLVAHDLVGPRRILVFATAIGLAVPLSFAAVPWLAAQAHRATGSALARGLVGLATAASTMMVSATTAWPASDVVQVAIALAVGIVVASLWPRRRGLRLWLSALTPALLVVPTLFLAAPTVRPLLAPENDAATTSPSAVAPTPVPIVMVVLDELPLATLVDPSDRIDAVRFPTFAALARGGTWFPNAVSVAQNTAYAVPALLTGRSPDRDRAPSAADHPDSLFVRLAAAGYRLRVMERSTRLCPRSLCAEPSAAKVDWRSVGADLVTIYAHRLLPRDLAERWVPPIGEAWAGFARSRFDSATPRPSDRPTTVDEPARLDTFLGALDAFGPQDFAYLHLLLPHVPWQYLPDGRGYSLTVPPRRPHGLFDRGWRGSPWETHQAHQRHQLQTRFTDRLLGRLVERLRTAGRWEETLLIVVADHGTSFAHGRSRRVLDRTNSAAIVNVPMFVKWPEGVSDRAVGAVDRRLATTTDLVPTILDVIGLTPPVDLDGRSLRDPAAPERDLAAAFRTGGARLLRSLPIERDAIERGRAAAVATQVERLGTGADDPYAIGRDRALVGRAVASLSVEGRASGTVQLRDRDALESVDPDAARIPARLEGSLEGVAGWPRPIRLAIALDGVVRATTEAYERPGEVPRWSAIVDPASLRRGAQRLDILRVLGPTSQPRLIPLMLASAPQEP